MNILALDTSGPSAGVAVLRDGEVAYECVAVNRMTHSVNLLPMVEEALTRSGLNVEDIDLYGAVVGPGSFTGVRIGVSTVKGMAHGAGRPCVGLDALEALASSVSPCDMLVCPIQDARAGQVYGAAFLAGMPPERMMSNVAEDIYSFLEMARDLCEEGRRLCFVGDGSIRHRATLQASLGDQACFLPAHLAFLRPAGVALLAEANMGNASDYLRLQPQYLRDPQAVRAREAARQKAGRV